ncbi:hypothetical protein [Mycobacteroides abscessus]|uniref:hypothetical protein n=1 Tax=Mycobacteroides abscessus TaxID=36809 RepID=UPI0012FFF814|nr:hypothetical protein [Mycobacteroides abscessus]
MKLFTVLPLALALACSSPAESAKADPPVNHQQITDRYTKEIWPAIADYNDNHSQGSAPYKKFGSIMDPSLLGPDSTGGMLPLMEAAQRLGQQGVYDQQTQTSNYNDGLHLGNVDAVAINGNTATLNVCYTYTHFWYVNSDNTQSRAAVSEATMQLVSVNNAWYLHAITDDHFVSGCTASQKA